MYGKVYIEMERRYEIVDFLIGSCGEKSYRLELNVLGKYTQWEIYYESWEVTQPHVVGSREYHCPEV